MLSIMGAILVVVFGNINNLWRTVRFGWAKKGRRG